MFKFKELALVKFLYRPALKRLRHKFWLVHWRWFVALKLKNLGSRKLKVGFGPVVTGENTLHTRKWWIDPIVNEINCGQSRYVADIFFEGDDLGRFDIVVLVKTFDFVSDDTLDRLKKRGILFIFAIVDNPSGCRRGYDRETAFLSKLDGLVVCNPVQQLDIVKHGVPFLYIDTPNINSSYKQDYADKETITIIWEGTYYYMPYMESVERIIGEIAAAGGKKIEFIYFTNRPGRDNGMIKHVRWNLAAREEILCAADIAVTVKSEGNKYQVRKPATKVLTYMAAGLPLICTPSEADIRVLEHGVTGFFAYSDEEWKYYLEKLINDPALRKQIGTAGREFVAREFSIAKTTVRYIDFFDQLVEGENGAGDQVINHAD